MPTSSGNGRWHRFTWDAEGRARWELWEARHFLYPVAFASLVGLGYLEIALWQHGIEPWWPFGPSLQSAGGAALLVAAFLLNAWSLDRFMAGKTKREAEAPAWIRGLRFFAAGVPVLGLLALPAWRWMLAERPGWLCRKKRVLVLDLRSPRLPSLPSSGLIERWRRRASQSLVFLIPWLISTQILAYLAALSSLAAGPLDLGRRWVVIGACGLLHLTLYGCVAGYARLRRPWAPRWAGPLLRYGPWLLFLPFPFTCLGILVWLPAAEETREEKTLSHRAYTQRNQSPRPDLQSRLTNSVRRVWQTVQQTRQEVDEVPGDSPTDGAFKA